MNVNMTKFIVHFPIEYCEFPRLCSIRRVTSIGKLTGDHVPKIPGIWEEEPIHRLSVAWLRELAGSPIKRCKSWEIPKENHRKTIGKPRRKVVVYRDFMELTLW